MRTLLQADAKSIDKVVRSALANGYERRDVWLAIGAGLESFVGDVHGRLALVSWWQLSRQLPIKQQIAPLYLAARLLKSEQAGGSPPSIVPPLQDKYRYLSRTQQLDRLFASFAASDSDTVSQCIRAIHQAHGTTLTTSVLTRIAAREDNFAGHGTMYVAQGLRWLDTHRWAQADATLDAMVRYLSPPRTGQAPVSQTSQKLFESMRLPRPDLEAAMNPGHVTTNPQSKPDVMELLAIARVGDGVALAKAVEDALLAGVSPGVAFTALTLAGAEYKLNDASGTRRGLHGFDLVNAMNTLSRKAPTPRDRLIQLRMCAHRLVAFRPVRSASPRRPITSSPPTPTNPPSDAADLRQRLLRPGAIVDLHDLKFPVAILEQAALAPTWARPMLYAAAGA